MSLPSKPEYEIIVADTPELKKESLDVRNAVFIDEQGFPPDTEIDEYDQPGASSSLVLRLRLSLQPIGTIRIVSAKNKIGRLCILSPYRKYGFGAELMKEAHKFILAKVMEKDNNSSGVEVVLHSQIPAMRFYEKLGYVPRGEQFDEDGAPHQVMVLNLKPGMKQ